MGVGYEQVFVFLDKAIHVLMKSKKCGVTGGSLKMFKNRGLEL